MFDPIHPLLAQAEEGTRGSPLGTLLPILLMVVVFYFLLIRPQQRRQRQQRELLSAVKVGDEVVTIGGMYGTVTRVDDEDITVEIAPGVDIRMLKQAIARRLVSEEELAEEDEEAGEQT